MAVDLRALLRKYINVVGEAEGVTFLHKRDWTEEEWAVLQEVQSEAEHQFNLDKAHVKINRERQGYGEP